MNLEQLITSVRFDYLDDDPESTPKKYLWDDEFMFRAFTEAERQACNRQNLLYDDSSAEYTQIQLIDGQSSYDVPQKVTKIEYVGFEDLETVRQSKHELNRNNSDWRTETGMTDNPTQYFMRGHKLRFVPSPLASKDATFIQLLEPTTGMVTDDTWWDTTNSLLYLYSGSSWVATTNASLGTVSLEVFRLPECDLANTSDEPEIAEEYHRDLIYWVLHEAYKKQDADSFQQERSDDFLARFTEVFGEYISAEIRLNQMQQRGSLHLRPTRYTSRLTRSTNADDWDDL